MVRRIYEAVARRDAATPFELYADDIVWDISASARGGLMTRPVFHGHEGVRDAWRESYAVWGHVDLEVDELADGGDRVFAAVRDHVIGRTSGAPAETTHYAVWTLAEGKGHAAPGVRRPLRGGGGRGPQLRLTPISSNARSNLPTSARLASRSRRLASTSR